MDYYEARNRTETQANELWVMARKGKFPPWIPTISRGEEAVGRLGPERLSSKRLSEVVDAKPLKKGAAKKAKIDTSALNADGFDLLPSGRVKSRRHVWHRRAPRLRQVLRL